ncbi:hypothetical protein C8J56DRAFT_904932 [Mycena floridula]|nr:hypothetical protein C8J56DRAFT_904932 [Mycena floridula]
MSESRLETAFVPMPDEGYASSTITGVITSWLNPSPRLLEVRLQTFETIASLESSGAIFQQQLHSSLAHSSMTVIIIPPRCPPDIPSASEVISGEELCARVDKYECDEVIKTMLSDPPLGYSAIIYGLVLNACGSMCATYTWVTLAFELFQVFD